MQKILVTIISLIVLAMAFGVMLVPINNAEAKEWRLYVGEMPKHWEPRFGNLLFHATEYWEEQFPGERFYKVSNLKDADFVVQWASEYQADEKTNTKKLGYYTTNTVNEYGRPYVAITLGYMTGEGLNKKFELVDGEYALLITVHELGHAIGLAHSDDPDSIMYPSIYNYDRWLLEKTSDLQQDVQVRHEPPMSQSVESGISFIPDWIRNNAIWWSESKIPDDTFVLGISYLLQSGILQIDLEAKENSVNQEEIPSWLRSSVKWWGEGMLSDDEFVDGLQYLIDNGILKI